jgi:hypothetical protein
VAEGNLKEFAQVGGDDREPDEEEILRKLAAQWWNGTEQQMAKAQNTLAAMGWEIGQDESGDDDAGVFVIRAGDVNGNSYIAFNHSDLDLNEGVAEGSENNNTTAQKIFFARSDKAPKGWSYDHVGFITQDGRQIQMSGHKGNDVYVTNDVTDDPEFPKQNIKIVTLSKPVSVPLTNSVGAENCGTFVANVLQANGIKGIDTQKIYSVFKKPQEQGVAEGWSQKYKSSINCANPKGFSQKAHCAGRNKNEDVAEGGAGSGRPDPTAWDNSSGKVGRVEKTATGLRHHADHSRYGGTIPDPEHDKLLNPQQRWRLDKITQPVDDMDEGEQQPGADYRDPKKVDYDDEYDAMVARVKKLAGLGPMKTVYDPARRVYKNVPTAVQPKK